jgi:hypothetical protein
MLSVISPPKTSKDMDTLDKELNELKGFIAELKEDRAAQKEKEKREGWTKYTSMSLVFIAVLAAIATQWAGKYSSRTLVQLNTATFLQAAASDKWGEFQANSIKRNLYQTIHDFSPKDASADAADPGKRENAFAAKVKKYEDGQTQSSTEAKEKEKQRDAAQAIAADSSKHGSGMGNAVAIYQISIAMGSICLVTKKKWLWYVSIALAVLATVQMVLVWVV